ncbi:uncharacterized protein BJ212DRAFT_1297079 [Suillus subaureus]|uniref:Uncharacterized protein n=1 Tax=Suillus subaureus TaxID=48587 RepID=A0A9P7JGS4_9AGAM|nr:uncharacterized protein BJ212DRAFT_1297079 [Suillus subaureus]KAG1821753.1 hypothetical protein BJ212DRAFT_1297079 [Suillus subaureus]
MDNTGKNAEKNLSTDDAFSNVYIMEISHTIRPYNLDIYDKCGENESNMKTMRARASEWVMTMRRYEEQMFRTIDDIELRVILDAGAPGYRNGRPRQGVFDSPESLVANRSYWVVLIGNFRGPLYPLQRKNSGVRRNGVSISAPKRVRRRRKTLIDDAYITLGGRGEGIPGPAPPKIHLRDYEVDGSEQAVLRREAKIFSEVNEHGILVVVVIDELVEVHRKKVL